MPIVHPPIDPEAFMEQTCDEEEYTRECPPGSKTPYVRGGHCAYDFQAPPERRTIYAVCDGTVRYVDHGPNLGIQLSVLSEESGFKEAAFYAHLAKRLVPDGATVKAGDEIAIMGNTSKRPVGVHLHFETHRDWQSWRSAYDPGPQLRALLEEMTMALSKEDKVWLENVIKTAVRTTVAAIGWGFNNPGNTYLPESGTWPERLRDNNLRALREALGPPKEK